MSPPVVELAQLPSAFPDTIALHAIADAGQEIAKALNRIADEAAEARKDVEPITEFFGGMTMRLEKACGLLKTHRVKIVLGVVAVLSAANWLPPAAADAVKSLIGHQ